MDFAFLPPEVNSARMYMGPGSGSMLAAAGTWDLLAAELSTTAESYETVLSGLNLQWQGPASEAMTAATAHYMAWLLTTAEQTNHTAMQARAAAAAYEQAYAMTVPPPAVTANRTQLQALIATNLLGQNTAAIAATEAQYAAHWAQDAAAMTGYVTSSAAATQLTPFSSPNPTTNASGLTAQSAAVTQASAAATADPVTDAITSALTSALQSLQSLVTNPLAIIPDDLTVLDVIAATGTSINSTYYLEAFAGGVIGAENNLGVLPKLGASAAATAELTPAPAVPPPLVGGAGLGNITATLTGAGRIGPMSVPATWAAPSTTRITEFTPAGFTTLPGTDETAAAGYPGYPGLPAGSRSGVGAPPATASGSR